MTTRRALPWLRALGGVLILALLGWWVGSGPFLAGLKALDPRSVLLALAVGLASTLCCAWRWRVVAAGLGVALPMRDAVAAYYRSQLLNATLPTGVVGDLHRALRHGRALDDVGLATRAVVLERAASLTAQVTIAGLVLLAASPPLRGWLWIPLVALAAALLARPGLVLVALVSSGLALTCHLAVFLVAARAAGSTAPLPSLVAPLLLALLAMALPLSVAGWGPRESAAAWAFGAAGLGAGAGVTTAVAYGLLSLVACLPGVVVLVSDALRSVRPAIAALEGGWNE
jgi:uncharacterized membrane protein YbhN (UPF0104 family)